MNGIQDPHRIHVGQKIFVPGATRQLPVTIITPSNVGGESPGESAPDRESPNGFIWPAVGNVASGFGPRGDNFHDGLDISVP
jgi:murein DD-endopeptidase MepM/ murein hydrolase activator NlpD